MTAPEGLFEQVREDVAAQILYASRVDLQFYIDGLGPALPHKRRGLTKTLARRFLSPGVTAQWRRNKRVNGR